MSVLAPWFIAASAGVVLFLGLVHLLYTFRGSKLHPREPHLIEEMRRVPLVLTRQTTMWRAWVGFNASHSFGAILFGAVYGYLALIHATFLLQSHFLLGVGLVLLLGYAVLGKLYWFSVPYRGIVLATGFYVVGLLAASMSSP